MAASLAVACALPGAWSEAQSDLLPASSTGRVEAAVRVPDGARLELECQVEGREGDGRESRLEVWLHSEEGVVPVATASLGADGRAHLEVDLADHEGTSVFLSAVVRGVSSEEVRWTTARLRGRAAGSGGAEEWSIRAPAGKPNILVYLIDALRADAVGAYGGPRVTPTLDRLVEEGVFFRNAYATTSWTRASIASLFSGLYPSAHGTMGRDDVLAEEVFTMAERMRLLGYQTIAVAANGNVDETWGFDQGFERYIRPDPDGHELSWGGRRPYLLARNVHALARRALEDVDLTKPTFLYVHVVDPHLPYDPPDWLLEGERPGLEARADVSVELNTGRREASPELLDALWRLYLGEVAYVDREFGQFLGNLEDSRYLDDALVAITSDHGEQFFEHGGTSHGMSLHEEEIHVPLILWGSGRLPAGVGVSQPVSLVDLLPTLTSMVGGGSRSTNGVDLAALWSEPESEDAPRPILAELDLDQRAWEALRLGQWKLLSRGRGPGQSHHLYNLAEDPDERDDRYKAEEELALRLLALKEKTISRLADMLVSRLGPVAIEPDPELTENLKALGYLR